MAIDERKLSIRFHGRILEHLGIQIYQSPVNALAELIANAWDADAEMVQITLPDNMSVDSTLIVKDNGSGMTFDECQNRFLQVGWNRRGGNPNEVSKNGRPVLGRKGIGKFAGFGIAGEITIDTISHETGERTIFSLDLASLMGSEYISTEEKLVSVLRYEPGNESRKMEHGTTLTLSKLSLVRLIPADSFTKSMARRFLLHQQQANFLVLVNGSPLPESIDLEKIEFSFPKDYSLEQIPSGITEIDKEGWGTEKIADHNIVKWRFLFHKETIDEEELRGVAIFAKGKIAQAPFLFNLTGGLGGQHGVEYLSGQVQADFIDLAKEDLIATERQRINWDRVESRGLEEWGRIRIKQLLRIWRDRRGEERLKQLEEKVSTFGKRMEKLPNSEVRTIKRALSKLAQVPTLNHNQFEELGDAILTAWEQGRLRDLIANIAATEELSEAQLLNILVEAQVLTALNTAEAIKTKILTVLSLQDRIKKHELETAVRDFISQNPWLISMQWETYRVERSVQKLAKEAADEAELKGEKWEGRVDLALSSGHHLLILEFMRPGLDLDWEHLQRFERYVLIIRSTVEANTGGKFKTVTGFIIADSLGDNAANREKIKAMKNQDMFALDWETLFQNALSGWQEFLDILVSRVPEDERLQSLLPKADKKSQNA